MRSRRTRAASLWAVGLAAALAVAAPSTAHGQSTRQLIDSARKLYEDFNVESARPILLRIISPGYLQQVSSQEKSEALKYLGASYAVLASPDSARDFFMAALDFDPFTDLDPTKFAASELGAFNLAKTRLFKVGIRPMTRRFLLRPQLQADSSSYTFRVITTQRANLVVDILGSDTSIATGVKERLYSGPNDNVRGFPFNGVLANGRFIPPGIYTLRAEATPTGGTRQTETMVFQVEHIFEPLEDTLPTLDPLRELLPPSIPKQAPWFDLGRGGWLAASAIAVPLAVRANAPAKTGGDKMGWATHATAAAGIALIGAGASFWYHRRYPEIQENVRENERRQSIRRDWNARVSRDNLRRLSQTVMVIAPVAGR